jgi:transposase-like protein
MARTLTVTDFFRQFPDDETCLVHVFRTRFGDNPACPQCGGVLHRLSKLPAWTCNAGHHVHPMQGTPFERTRTPLQKWFYAMYLFTASRHGVPAKELQRQLGVTYKTAWRMGREIRKHRGEVDGDGPPGGHVEIDKAFVGGKVSRKSQVERLANKTMIVGMVQRVGDTATEILPSRLAKSIYPLVMGQVRVGSTVTTDDAPVYDQLGEQGYRHEAVKHSAEEYVRGEHRTDTIEGFWSILQRAIRGTHIHVSPRHLDKYLLEFEFRFNLRKVPHLMFPRLMASFARRPHPRSVGVLPFAR